MSYLKTKGIVIKEVNTGEADRVVTILCKNYGRITGFAKGARRPKNRISAGTQLLCYSDFILFKGKDMYNISSCDIIESFYEIRNDLVKLTCSAHIMDLIADVIQENQPASKVLQLFLNSLFMLAKTDKSPELVTRIFEFRFLSILGYAPNIKVCCKCSSDDFNEVFFSFKNCGLLCSSCRNDDPSAIRISQGAVKALNHIMSAKMDKLFNFEVSQGVLNELSKVGRRYIRDRFERDYNKMDFLNSLDL